MKKFCLIILALAGILFSCTNDADTTYESDSNITVEYENISDNMSELNIPNPEALPSNDKIIGITEGINEQEDIKTEIPFFDIYQYLNLLIDYFHDSYEIGDTLIDHNIMYLCALLCACSENVEPMFVQFTENDGVITISEDEMETLAVWLFGDSIDLSLYHNTFSGYYDTFYSDSGVYTFSKARDYWNAKDDYFYYRDNMTLEENNETITVEIIIENTGYLVDASIEQIEKCMQYRFAKNVYNGLVYYQLIEVKECLK